MFVDLKMVFDTVDHEILCKKLSHYGIKGLANERFCSYLTKRKQYNVIGNELLLFRPNKLKLDHSFKFMIDGKRLIPIHSMKYLGVLLDEHMSWNEQIYQIKLKLNCAISILRKLRSHANLNTLRIAYYSLFQSHLQYDVQRWG